MSRDRSKKIHNVVSLSAFKKTTLDTKNIEESFLLPFFETLFEITEAPPKAHTFIDTFQFDFSIGQKRYTYEVQATNFRIWSDQVHADIRITEKLGSKFILDSTTHCQILIQIFERLTKFLIPACNTAKSHFSDLKFYPKKLLVQSQHSECSSDYFPLKIWVISANSLSELEWAGQIDTTFLYTKGILASQTLV